MTRWLCKSFCCLIAVLSLINFKLIELKLIFFCRAEQSRSEQSRADNIDILKATCAFLIVCIHVPFPGVIGEYFTALTRIAVPVFFMITGYFYFDVEEKNGETRQIKKIFKLVLEANVLYLLWDSFYAVLSRNMSFFA